MATAALASEVQKEHGHSPIAHPILEALALAPFSTSHLKIVLYLIRQTYGWSRTDAILSHATIAAATGLKGRMVTYAMRDLVDAGVLLVVTEPTFRNPGRYALQKDPRRWGRYATLPPSLACNDAEPEEQESATGASGCTSGNALQEERCKCLQEGGASTCTSDGSQVLVFPQVTRAENKVLKQRKANTYSDDFEAFWKAYPKRHGPNSKADAYKQWNARLKGGTDPAEIMAGLRRYAAYLEATDRIGTEYVKQAATFLGPGRHWEDSYDCPAPAGKRTPPPGVRLF